MNATGPETFLCRLDEVADGGSAALGADIGGRWLSLMVLRQGAVVRVYVNSCPHIGAPLDFTPGQFLDPSGTHILCTNHAALFTIDDGRCVRGPCAGKWLTRVPERVDADGRVWVSPPPSASI